MEVIELPGYTTREKVEIAKPSSWCRGSSTSTGSSRASVIDFSDDVLLRVIEEYTREAGVRNLEREIAALVRQVGAAASRRRRRAVSRRSASRRRSERCSGRRYFTHAAVERIESPGRGDRHGLDPGRAARSCSSRPPCCGQGKGLKLTGQLGDVMQESAEAALSYLRSNAERLGIDPELFEKNEIHIHVPAGAMKKDGPSAGVTLLVALASLLRAPVARTTWR